MSDKSSKQHCLRCDYRWESRVADPKECPACHSRLWNVPKKKAPQSKTTRGRVQ